MTRLNETIGQYNKSMNMVRESTRLIHGCNDTVINYSGRSMTMTECKQLCKRIITNDHIEDIRFSDFLLSEEIANSIINALACNKTIKVADFKGNNFRANGAEQLCKLLKQTTTLSELYLEWNALGLYDTSMSAIAEGLAVNKSVQVLDLSNNQICHSGGKLLSLALRRNKTLKSLDMRWNNIGVTGGRELLSALQINKNLLHLQLAGNNIPGDTLKAISTAIQRNVEHHSMYQQHVTMTQSLKDEIDHIQHEKTLEVTTLENELEKEKELHETFTMTTQSRLEELRTSLKLISSEKDAVAKANAQIENDLKSATVKINYLEESMTDLTKTNTELRKTHFNEMKTIEETMNKERKQWQVESTVKDNQILSLQKEIKLLQGNLDNHSAEINNLKCVVKTKEENENAEGQKHQREKEWLKRENADQLKTLTDKITRHLNDKEQLEEEVTKLKTTIMNNKLKHDEDLVTQRTRWKQEDVFKAKQYEERVDILNASKDELQSKISKLMIQETEAHTKLITHQKDIENYKQLMVQHQESANQRDQEHRNEVNKFHADIDNEKRECRNLRSKVDVVEKKCANFQSEINQLQSSKYSEIAAKESEIASLKEIIKNKEDEMRRNHQEELNRTSMLESALQTYIISARSNKH